MDFEKETDEWIEITPEELNSIFEGDDDIELDLDEFVSYYERMNYELKLEEEQEEDWRKYVEIMERELSEGNYCQAFKNAVELKRRCYASFKDEIDSCIRICAEHDVRGALVMEAGKYTCRGTGNIKPGAFKYLKRLGEIGYIKSFRWLADCYFYGIDCKRDVEKAGRLYFEGMLFDKCEYCRKKYSECHPEAADYSGDDLLKRLMCELVSHSGWWSDNARIKIAEMILDGTIGDYDAESAYVLLKGAKYESDDGMAEFRLGECLLFGIGTDPDPVVASFLLNSAVYSLKRAANNELSEERIRDAYHEDVDFEEVYERARELQETAKQRKEIALNDYDYVWTHEGFMDQDLAYDEWEKVTPRYIKRSKRFEVFL